MFEMVAPSPAHCHWAGELVDCTWGAAISTTVSETPFVQYLSWIAAGLSALAAGFSGFTAWRVARHNLRAEQLKNLLYFCEKFIELSRIEPANPIDVDIRNAKNTMEMLAEWYEADQIDKKLTKTMLGQSYVDRYNEIRQCPGGVGRLADTPAIGRVYDELSRS